MIVAPAVLLGLVASTNAYWLMGIENFITTERLDPIVSPGKISNHVHSVLGGSNFRMSASSSANLRQSSCTSVPIPQDKSNYWFPHLYFLWRNQSVTSVNGGAVIYYLYSDKPGTTTAFPDDFRMITGDMTLRNYDPKSFAQQAVSFLCLDFGGVTTRHAGIPNKSCPSGIRSQINFPSCWDGKRTDSPDHKSHVAFPSGGPDSGTCNDARYPVTIPRIFIEVYWDSNSFDAMRNQAMNPSQPFVFAQGDPTGFGYHADFVNGWEPGVLQNAVDRCHCNPYGDPTCCANQGIFTLTKGKKCRITPTVDESTTGTLLKLPGNNPVVGEGRPAPVLPDNTKPPLISPIYVYTGHKPTAVGNVAASPVNVRETSTSEVPDTKATSSSAVHSTSPSTSSSHAAATSSTPIATPTASTVSLFPPAVRPTRTPRPLGPRSDVEASGPEPLVSEDAATQPEDTLKPSLVKTTRKRKHNHRRFHNGQLTNLL